MIATTAAGFKAGWTATLREAQGRRDGRRAHQAPRPSYGHGAPTGLRLCTLTRLERSWEAGLIFRYKIPARP